METKCGVKGKANPERVLGFWEADEFLPNGSVSRYSAYQAWDDDGDGHAWVGFVELAEGECKLAIEDETPEVFVACLNKSLSLQAFTMTQQFRAAGLRAEMDHQGRSLKAQFKYADKLSAKYIAILADDELARGVVKLRDMTTKEEWETPLEDAAEALKARL